MTDQREEPHPGEVGRDGGAGELGTAGEDAPTQQLGLTAVGDRCVACGAPLSGDQRYCVNCGERRSAPRFSLSDVAPATEVATSSPRPPRRPRASSGATLIAGIGTLLLAMGVGVLIGRTDAKSSGQAGSPRVQVVTVGGGSSANSSTAAASAPSPKTGHSKSKSKSKSNSTSKPTAVVAKKATAAASKVLGSNANLPPATVTVGQSGSGPGYQKGHFSGTFFGH